MRLLRLLPLFAALGLLGAAAGSTSLSAQVTPFVKKHIYPDVSAAQPDLTAAIAEARAHHKRILVDFGGDWCGDCQVLDIYFHQPPNASLLEKNFVVVHVNVGHIDQNLEYGDKFHVALRRGVPALAVLDSSGRPIYGQAGGEFENMRNMQPQSVTEFLNKWKPSH